MEEQLPKIVPLEQIERVTCLPEFKLKLIKAIADGFVRFHHGNFFAAPIQTLGVPPQAPFSAEMAETSRYAAQTCVKSGYFRGNPYYVIKVASGGYPWRNAGLMQIYSQSTGRLEALLLDKGILTELRTAAVGALSIQLWGPKQIDCIGILGTGVQARYQLDMIQQVTSCRKVLVWGRSTDRVQELCSEMGNNKGWDIAPATTPDDLLNLCDAVVTTTSAREPLLGKEQSTVQSVQEQKCRLLVCIGADAPGKMELDMGLIRHADLRIADSLEQTRERGEFQRWCQETANNEVASNVVALGQAVEQEELHRSSVNDPRLIIVDSSGVALQDCVVAQMVVESLSV